jgi:alpha-1,6-mannosyltransferase
MDRKRIIGVCLFFLLSAAGYVLISYFTPRTNFVQLIGLYAFIFILYAAALRFRILQLRLGPLLIVALLLRLSFITSIPNLTDDYYRYIWDGLLWTSGYNPYLSFPAEFAGRLDSITGMTPEIFNGLNSANYFTVYPPFAQLIFGVAALIAGGNIAACVIVTRTAILLAEAGTIILIYKTSSRLQLPLFTTAIYAFNPLVIIELSGNLHFEAFMVFFLALSLYLLINKRLFFSAIVFGLAAGAKLVPLIFLPLLIRRLGARKSTLYFLVTAAAFGALLIPFFSSGLPSSLASLVGLYFQKFEFNASIFYLLRWAGFGISGYDQVAILGPSLAAVVLMAVVFIAAKEQNKSWQLFFRSALLCITIYYLLATTVHPWYITTMVMLSCLTGYRYPVAWSAVIILSYAAYQAMPYTENYWLIAVEYAALAGWMVYEFSFKQPMIEQSL